jgi:hypothetical protein
MAQPPKVEKHGEFGVTSQFVIEVQPLFIRNSFQTVFCLRALVSIEIPLFKPKWVWNKIPRCHPRQDRQLALDEPDLSHYGLKSDIGPCPKSARTITALGKVVGRAIRKCPVGRSLALLVACELTQPREAVLFTL